MSRIRTISLAEFITEGMKTSPKPVGRNQELIGAIRMIDENAAQETRRAVRAIVYALLGRLQRRSPTLAAEQKRLIKLEQYLGAAAKVIDALSPYSRGALSLGLPGHAHRPIEPKGIYVDRLTIFKGDLSDFVTSCSVAHKRMSEQLGTDTGGSNVTISRRAYGDPYKRFITDLIGVYGTHRGLASVTTTIDSKKQNCYAFIDAVHRYATGKTVGRDKLFKKLVQQNAAEK